ncbi:MAG: polyketide synthase dehydratase domain-containing protein [Vicinamibacterales bacterium]
MPFLTPVDRESTGVPAGTWPFTLRPDDPCFAGHFDDAPVLPGIAHVAIALEACARLTPAPGPLVALDDLRFLQPLLPGDRCVIAITASPPAARFEIRRDGVLASSGRLTFASGGAV